MGKEIIGLALLGGLVASRTNNNKEKRKGIDEFYPGVFINDKDEPVYVEITELKHQKGLKKKFGKLGKAGVPVHYACGFNPQSNGTLNGAINLSGDRSLILNKKIQIPWNPFSAVVEGAEEVSKVVHKKHPEDKDPDVYTIHDKEQQITVKNMISRIQDTVHKYGNISINENFILGTMPVGGKDVLVWIHLDRYTSKKKKS